MTHELLDLACAVVKIPRFRMNLPGMRRRYRPMRALGGGAGDWRAWTRAHDGSRADAFDGLTDVEFMIDLTDGATAGCLLKLLGDALIKVHRADDGWEVAIKWGRLPRYFAGTSIGEAAARALVALGERS